MTTIYKLVQAEPDNFEDECNKLSEEGFYPMYNLVVIYNQEKDEAIVIQQWAKDKRHEDTIQQRSYPRKA